LFDPASAFDIEVPGITGLGLRVMNPFTVLPGGRQVGQFGAVNHHQVNLVQPPDAQAAAVGQVITVNLEGS